MDLKFNDDQNMMKKVAADFVKAEAPPYVITDWYQKKQAFIPEIYKKTADVGWLGMMVPDEFGGGGAAGLATAFGTALGAGLAVVFLTVAFRTEERAAAFAGRRRSVAPRFIAFFAVRTGLRADDRDFVTRRDFAIGILVKPSGRPGWHSNKSPHWRSRSSANFTN